MVRNYATHNLGSNNIYLDYVIFIKIEDNISIMPLQKSRPRSLGNYPKPQLLCYFPSQKKPSLSWIKLIVIISVFYAIFFKWYIFFILWFFLQTQVIITIIISFIKPSNLSLVSVILHGPKTTPPPSCRSTPVRKHRIFFLRLSPVPFYSFSFYFSWLLWGGY